MLFIKKTFVFILGVSLWVFLASASGTPTQEVPNKKTMTPLEYYSAVRQNLQTKSENESLSNTEKRQLKRSDRKVTRWERQNEKLVKKGKAPNAGKSWGTALILSIFLGVFAIDRFYLGYKWQSWVKLLTAGGAGIWYLVDIFMIGGKSLKPKDGDYE